MNGQSKTTALIVNLDETDLVLESVERLRDEGDIEVVVVDNGSDDAERLADLPDITTVFMGSNQGVSKARNAGLAVSSSDADYVFLLDGDILYIPRTIRRLIGIAESLPAFGCVGVHNPRVMNGVQKKSQADPVFPLNSGGVFKDFDMAWTQYGLFNARMLKDLKFVEEGVFGEAGNGYEDDWLWHAMKEKGFVSYYVPDVLYYHEQHGGQRWLDAHGLPNKNEERKAMFIERWGEGSAWYEKERHYDYLAQI
jgi:glycosyltransferase involved in cell wall biosynthesis